MNRQAHAPRDPVYHERRSAAGTVCRLVPLCAVVCLPVAMLLGQLVEWQLRRGWRVRAVQTGLVLPALFIYMTSQIPVGGAYLPGTGLKAMVYALERR